MDFEKVNRIVKVHHYKKKGFSNAKISRMLGIHRNTVRSDLEKRPDEAIAWVEMYFARLFYTTGGADVFLDFFKQLNLVSFCNQSD